MHSILLHICVSPSHYCIIANYHVCVFQRSYLWPNLLIPAHAAVSTHMPLCAVVLQLGLCIRKHHRKSQLHTWVPVWWEMAAPTISLPSQPLPP